MLRIESLNETGVVCPNGTHARIVASGPLTKQPMTIAYRLVLCQLDDGGFVVWDNRFAEDGRNYLADGDYFKNDKFVDATVRFCERLQRSATTHFESVYREMTAVRATTNLQTEGLLS